MDLAVETRRILCLHGSGSSGAEFHAAMGTLRQALPSWTFEFADAPHSLRGNLGKTWWLLPPGERSFTAHAYDAASVDATMQLLADVWRERPFDGLIGFSQGAMLAAVAVANRTILPKWVVCCGAARPRPYERLLEQEASYGGLPRSLHLLSKRDVMNPPEMGEWLAERMGGEVMWHEAGHAMPNDGATLARVVGWVESGRASASDHPASEPSD